MKELIVQEETCLRFVGEWGRGIVVCVRVRELLTTAHLSKEENNVELMNGRSSSHTDIHTKL